jgi:hypothetical protein
MMSPSWSLDNAGEVTEEAGKEEHAQIKPIRQKTEANPNQVSFTRYRKMARKLLN